MPKLSDTAEAHNLAELMVRLMRSFHRHSAGDTLSLMNEHGLTMGQMVALFILGNTGQHSMGALAQKVHLSPAAATYMIGQLVEAGLVSRFDVPQDRRSKHIEITPKGRALIQKLELERRRELAGSLNQLKPQTLRKLRQALQAALEDFPQDYTPEPARSQTKTKLRGNK